MRSFLIIILIILYLIITLPILLILSLIRKKDEKKAERAAHACLCLIFKAIAFTAGVKLSVKGLENIPRDIPVLYAANHRSYFDIVLSYPLCSLPTSYVAKVDLKKIPLFGAWGTLMRALFFDRANAKDSIKMVLEGVSRLKTDTSIFIFPEGTRNKNASETPLLEFHNGSFKMASKSGRPVIPVAISNTAEVWEAHKPWVHSQHVTISYGAPVYIKDLPAEDQKKIGEYIKNIIEELLK